MEGVALSDLALTFQHAITIMRLLGFKYLSLNSLYIIQNSADHENWQTECSKMADYYRMATVTLFADASLDSSSGMIFRWTPRQAEAQKPVRLPLQIPGSNKV